MRRVDPEVVSTETRRWILLAIGSIVVAGLLSLAVVIGRLPFISQFIDDPLWFKRCLVVHVDLALVVWFYAFIAGLISMIKSDSVSPIRTIAFGASVIGVCAGSCDSEGIGLQWFDTLMEEKRIETAFSKRLESDGTVWVAFICSDIVGG